MSAKIGHLVDMTDMKVLLQYYGGDEDGMIGGPPHMGPLCRGSR